MAFDPKMAAVRFGTGLSKDFDPPRSARDLMRSVDGRIEQNWPMPLMAELQPLFAEYQTLRKQRVKLARNAQGNVSQQLKAVNDQLKVKNERLKEIRDNTLRSFFGRGVFDETGFASRLTTFWADHFAVVGKAGLWREMPGDYIDTAIRPNLMGRFEDMLSAVTFHPIMLFYLDQTTSIGPNSAVGKNRKRRGLNENLAREILELHTLGVDGPYNQTDVRNLAKLLTGLSAKPEDGFFWRKGIAEPGPHEILGQTYGRKQPKMEHINVALRDLARHPVTARHLAVKMARHFVSDTPSQNLVDAMVEGYGRRGNLGDMTEVMITHDDAFHPGPGNVKWAAEYMMGVMRAIGVRPERLRDARPGHIQHHLRGPMSAMGQPFFRANGPDGFEESDNELMSPQSFAARLEWALRIPDKMVRGLPDPRLLLDAIPGDVPQSLMFAVNASESRHEGLALLFVSPAFQRR